MSNKHYGISNHWQIDCLFSSLFRWTTKTVSKLHIIEPFVRESHQWLVDSPHKGPVIQKPLSCHDVVYCRIPCSIRYSKEILFNALCSISDSLITEHFSCVKTSHQLRPGQFKNSSWVEQNISHFMQVLVANGTAFLLIVLAHMCLVWGNQLLNLVDNVKISLEMECTGLRTFELKLFCLSYDSW